MTEKIYIDNPDILKLNAEVLSSIEKDGKFHTLLDKTIFYSTGVGGQEGDKGTINGIDIEYSYIENGDVYHVTSSEITDKNAVIEVDEINRLHIMQQHTTEHLLAQCFKSLFDLNTVSFQAHKDFVTFDLDCDSITDEEILEAENLANKIIYEDRPIKSYYPTEEEIPSIPFRKTPTVKENLRVTEIENFDYAACGGTHVKSTGDLKIVKILGYEKVNKKIRINAVSGLSALKDYQEKTNILNKIELDLSSNQENVLENFEKYKENENILKSTINDLKSKYLELVKKDLLSKKDNNLIIYNMIDIDFSEANLLTSKFKEDKIILSLIKKEDNSHKFLFYVSDNLDIELDEFFKGFKEEFSVRGGGRKKSFQGMVMEEDTEKLINYIKTNIK